MLKAIQRNVVLQIVLILTALFLLWGHPLIAPEPMSAGEHPAVLYSLLCNWLSTVPRLAVIIAMLLVLVEGVIFNLLLVNVGLAPQNSLLPTLLFVLVTGAGATTLTPALIVCGIAIVCLYQLMLRGTLLTIPAGKICSATALIGIASMFYLPAGMLMASYLLIAVNYRLYGWRDWMLMLLGLAAPYIALLTVLYLTDGIDTWWQDTVSGMSTFSMQTGTIDTLPAIGGFTLAAILLWGIVATLGRMNERPVLWQKNATTVILLTLGAIGMMLYTPLLPLQIILFALPFTFCVTQLLTAATEIHTGFGRHKRRTWMYDIVFVIIIIASLLC